MIDHVVAAGTPGEVFEPRQTTHGFQFARIEGHPGPLTVDDVTGVVVHTDLRRTGWFRCSDERLNRFHDITEWSFRDNACEIPTDCPQRERAGWAGDWQLFIPTAAFLYDVAGFSLQWLRDLAAEQLDNGCVTNYVPDALRQRVHEIGTLWTSRQGSSGWGDAIVMVPWEMWRAYGDEDVLAELWPPMVAWVDFAATIARTQRHPSRRRGATRAPVPTSSSSGTAATTGASGSSRAPWPTPSTAPTTAPSPRRSCTTRPGCWPASAACSATTPRRPASTSWPTNALDAWRTEFVGPDGTLTPDTQANHVRALAFGLVPDELRHQTAGQPGRADPPGRHAPGHRLPGHAVPAARTGRHRPPRVLPTSSSSRTRRRRGSSMVERGATTVWEIWEGIDADGHPHESLNHYCKGAVISFLHNYVAGITLARRAPRLPPLPGRAPPRRRPDLGRGGARLALRPDRVLLAPRGTALPA